MDDLIQKLQARMKHSIDCQPDVVANLATALEALERARLVRAVYNNGLDIDWSSLPRKTIKIKKRRI